MSANECEGLIERQDSDICPAADRASDDTPRDILRRKPGHSKSCVTREPARFRSFHKLELECPSVAAIIIGILGCI